MKKIILFIVATLILFSSCKDKIEEEITLDLIGDWNVISLNNGSIDETFLYDESGMNEYHTMTDLFFNDACGNSGLYHYEKHLKAFYVSFKSNGDYFVNKVFEITDIDQEAIDQSPCGTEAIYSVEMITETTSSTWSLNGKELIIDGLAEEFEIEGLDATELIISKASVAGNQRVDDLYARR